ncbi:MAG: NnrS family protein [Gammaproteobacteria bacterium]
MSDIIRTLLSYSFRAFFLLGSLCAFCVIFLWTLALLGYGPLAGHPNLFYWHAHEMVFGFVFAIVAGFVLTAVANWTGRTRIHGMELGALAAAWIVGRVALAFTGQWPTLVIATADMLFPCLLTFLFGREVFAANNRRNAPVVGVVALLAGLNLMFHIGAVAAPGLDRLALLLAVHVILVLVAIIAGRIIPSFTANWLRAKGAADEAMPRVVPMLDIAAILMTIVTGIAVTVAPANPISGTAALVAALVHAMRLSQWSGLRTVGEPLLFVLHIAYLWFPLGYALVALSVFGGYLPSAAMHALTIGAITGMIIAMMTRVSLGHTGRPLHAARITVFVYVLWMLSTLVRLSGPLLGDWYILTVETAATIWMVAFVLFAWVYWPILAKPRVD